MDDVDEKARPREKQTMEIDKGGQESEKHMANEEDSLA